MKTKNVLSKVNRSLFLLLFIVSLIFSGCSQQSETAKYTNLSDNIFLKTWMLLGPVNVADTSEKANMQKQQAAFDHDILDPLSLTSLDALSSISIKEQTYSWEKHTSESDIIDLNAVYDNKNFAFAYAFAEIEMQEAKTILCGLGSDDAVKVWLNGKEVHKYFGGRALSKDDDLVEIDFKQGSNQLLLKIQNFEYGWEFCFRPIGVEAVSELVCSAAGRGDLDNINELLKYEPDFSYKSKNGLTAWQNAMISGREEVIDLLLEKGAKEDQDFPELISFVDNYIQQNLKENTPGLAILIAKKWRRSF